MKMTNLFLESCMNKTFDLVIKRISSMGIFILTALILGLPSEIFAHGSMESPLSRVYNCRQENPENPKSAACQAAVETGGVQALYDWNSVRQGNANGQHRALVPDGQLCSGGSPTFQGLDLARSDWVATPIMPDDAGNFEFVYHATAPHATQSMEFYITKDGYDPTKPLAWNDLEEQPFCTVTSVTLQNQRYHMNCPLPQNKSGKHVIYHIWQRSDSPEAFYSCSDVTFMSGGGTPVAWNELGQIRAQQDLATGSQVTLRLFEADPNNGELQDVESYNLVIGEGMGISSAWPFFLAQEVNSNSSLVAIGVLQQNGNIQPVQDSQANRIYTQSDRQLNFEIEIRIPDPQNGVSPVAIIAASQTEITGPDTLLLSGAQSTDPNNLSLSYQWRLISGDAGIDTPTAAETAVVFSNISTDQTVTIELTVSNGTRDDKTSVTITHLVESNSGSTGNYDYVYPDGRGQYGPGTIVLGGDSNRYQCRPWPNSGWCNIASDLYYAPGAGLAWQEAWTRLTN